MGQVGSVAEADQHHLGGGAAVGGLLHLPCALQEHLPGAAEHGHGKLVGQGGAAGAFGFRQLAAVAEGGDGAEPGQGVGEVQEVAEHEAEVGAALMRAVGDGQGGGGLAGHDGLQQVEHGGAVGEAEHVGHGGGADGAIPARTLGDGLVQKGKAVAHGAVGGAGDQVQGAPVHGHALLHGDAAEHGGHLGDRNPAQVEALAAGQDGDGDLAYLRRRKNELHVRRRLFQRLQQRVERVAGEHVDFVYDEDLGARLQGAVAGGVYHLAHVVHAGTAGCVHLHHVRVAVGKDGDAVGANAAGIGGGAAVAIGADAVERAGDDACGGGLADASDAGEHPGVGDSVLREGVAEDADHRLLADQVGEGGGTILACQDAVGRGSRGSRLEGRGGWGVAEQAGATGRGRQVIVQGGVLQA